MSGGGEQDDMAQEVPTVNLSVHKTDCHTQSVLHGYLCAVCRRAVKIQEDSRSTGGFPLQEH